MEPNILASTQKSAAPSDEGWLSQADDVRRGASRDGRSGVARVETTDTLGPVAVRNGTGATARNGAGRHMNGSANGHGAAAWPELALATRAGAVRFLSAYEAPPEHGLYMRGGKRLLDLAGAFVALVLSSPLLLLAAILIKLESRGPVIYKSVRIGRGARPFTFFKLRTMVDGADQHRHSLSHLNETDGPVFKMARDPRVTRIGRWLRVTSLDEIPQLWNVLRGEMSLVGPRPPIAEEVVQYEPWQLRRLDVLPGITCLWQISGRSRIGFQEWMRLDLEYIKHRSFWLDMKILVRTIPAVLSREGAY
jgi:lipopolysaccharide/colanic/teichoic acid biosynthesis glycosyltransferase